MITKEQAEEIERKVTQIVQGGFDRISDALYEIVDVRSTDLGNDELFILTALVADQFETEFAAADEAFQRLLLYRMTKEATGQPRPLAFSLPISRDVSPS